MAISAFRGLTGAAAGAAGVTLLVLTTTACAQVTGSKNAEETGLMGDSTPSASTSHRPDPGPSFLQRGECGTRTSPNGGDADGVREVSCTSDRAYAQVVARHKSRADSSPRCPARTDFVLYLSEQRPDVDEDGDGAVSRGYACMRKLSGPHPGDPGGGGGPNTVTGDCVYTTREREVKETACDGSGEFPPGYRVFTRASERDGCPAGTDLYVRLGGAKPVGCARQL